MRKPHPRPERYFWNAGTIMNTRNEGRENAVSIHHGTYVTLCGMYLDGARSGLLYGRSFGAAVRHCGTHTASGVLNPVGLVVTSVEAQPASHGRCTGRCMIGWLLV